MFELFLTKIPNDCAFRAQNLNARAGKKEGGWGEGIFARPRFPIPIFFRRRISCQLKTGAPPLNYLKIKTPAIYEQKFITKDKVNNFFGFCCSVKLNNNHSTKITNNSKNIIVVVLIVDIPKYPFINKR
ncbi:MAG: hypothetical protein NTW79_01695 [Candidatus Berkelbacteria bacterium]|nr:hypothetical protein [Candidatus Berkelbacteria bacterium]